MKFVEAVFKEYQKEIIDSLNKYAKYDFFPFINNKYPIIKATPNSFHQLVGFKNKKPIIKAQFFTNNRVALALLLLNDSRISPFKQHPVYYNTSTFNPDGGERQGRITNNATWAGAQGAASSTSDLATAELSSQLNGGTFYNYRLFQPFNTSSLTTAAITILSSSWQGYRDDSLEDGVNGFQNADSTTAVIIKSNQASGTAYAATDYGGVTFTDKGSIKFVNINPNNTYQPISITDQTLISTTSDTKIGLITGMDLNNTTPTGLNCYTVQNKSQAHPPILTVNYTVLIRVGYNPQPNIIPTVINF